MSSLILVVEDDTSVREMVCDALQLAGYETRTAVDGSEALASQQKTKADLIVSDINMPKVDGYELAQRLRDRGDTTPIIFLTARNEKPDIGKGFRVGADDYISKPFGIEELVLRVAAILRRAKSIDTPKSLSVGPITVDLESVSVKLQGEVVPMSPTEFKLLVALIENKSRVVSRQFLMDEVWEMGFAESATVIDTYISYLRKKLHTSDFEGIRTIRGFGFQITDK
jgi:two-component system OmpR family response regulator